VAADVPLRQSIDLQPDPDSAAIGRRFLRQTLGGWAVPMDAAEQAVLVAGELLSNAILHAGTPLSLEITYAAPIVRIAVRDGSLTPPSVRSYRKDSMTGRGLRLVGMTSRSWGVEPLSDGKVVWATVDGSIPPQRRTRLSGDGAAVSDGPAPIRLHDVPLTAFLAMQQHHDAIVRELDLATDALQPDPLVELTRAVGTARGLLHRAALAARRRGQQSADLVVSLRHHDVEALRDWFVAMDDAERLVLRSASLTGPATHRVLTTRRHVLDELDRYLAAGAGPSGPMDGW
jgi:hypothetical protein